LLNQLASVEPQPVQARTAEQEALKAAVLASLESEIESQRKRLELANVCNAIEFASNIQEPGTPVLETLLRYRAANAREFKDMLEILERIPRLRHAA
jgi:hypothetical protein